jgi:hypothetical protein
MEARDISRSRPHPFQISLRVRHPSVDPETISRELKVEPEHSFKAGEPRESASGIAAAALHGETYWLGCLNASNTSSPLGGFSGTRARIARERMQGAGLESLTMALDASVIAFLRPHAEFIRRLQCEEGQVSLIIEISTHSLSGFTLSPTFTRTLYELGISLEFDFVAS